MKLGGCPLIGDGTLKALVTRATSLRTLHLRGCAHVTDGGLLYLATAGTQGTARHPCTLSVVEA